MIGTVVVLSVLSLCLAVKCLSYKVGCYALTMFFLEHGSRSPSDEEIAAYRQKVVRRIVMDFAHSPN